MEKKLRLSKVKEKSGEIAVKIEAVDPKTGKFRLLGYLDNNSKANKSKPKASV